MEVRHLRHPFLAATVEFLVHTLSLTPIGSIHQNFGQIRSTTMEL